jgi:hypothetical protein
MHGQFILYSVVGFLVLFLLFVINMVVIDFTVFWFLVGFRFYCSCYDVLLGCVVESELRLFCILYSACISTKTPASLPYNHIGKSHLGSCFQHFHMLKYIMYFIRAKGST